MTPSFHQIISSLALKTLGEGVSLRVNFAVLNKSLNSGAVDGTLQQITLEAGETLQVGSFPVELAEIDGVGGVLSAGSFVLLEIALFALNAGRGI